MFTKKKKNQSRSYLNHLVHKHYITRNIARLNIYKCVTDILDIIKVLQSRDSVVGRAGSNPFRDKLCISVDEFSDRAWGLPSPQFNEYRCSLGGKVAVVG